MDDRERQVLRCKIEEELTTLVVDIEQLSKQTKPIPPDRAIGRLTRMEAIQSKSITEASLRKAQVRERKLRTALQKVDDDPDYGICLICEIPIPVKRMVLVPASTRCVPCANPRFH